MAEIIGGPPKPKPVGVGQLNILPLAISLLPGTKVSLRAPDGSNPWAQPLELPPASLLVLIPPPQGLELAKALGLVPNITLIDGDAAPPADASGGAAH